jgi:AcrR family transcriptional regulator
MSNTSSAIISKIIAASCAEFATYGLGEAKIDRIARNAGTSKQLVYYYFGNKTGLYEASLEMLAQRLLSDFTAMDFGSMHPTAAVREFVYKVFDEHVNSLGGLSLDLAIRQGDHVTRRSAVHPLYKLLTDTLESIIQRGQSQGLFVDTLSSGPLYIMIVVICSGCVVSCGMQSKLLEIAYTDDSLNDYWRAYACDFIVNAISRH